MNTTTLFLEPLDVLFLRGNKVFGDPGSYGESLVPPWPSVAAGAIRSRMLADAKIDPAAFARGASAHPELGTPDQPGSFSIAAFHLACRKDDGSVERLVAPPADLVVSEGEDGAVLLRALAPQAVGAGAVASSSPLPLLPVLAETARSKPASGYWLTAAGYRMYLAGKQPTPQQLIKSSALWAIDDRIGVGLDGERRRASDGRLFSVQAVAMRRGVGFLAAVAGATPPQTGTVRLGGDGRAASVTAIHAPLPEPDYAAIAAARRCRLVLTTPGIFPKGWLPSGTDGDASVDCRFELHGVSGRLVCAAVPRAEVISGWDLARCQPKAAQRVAPAGSVYWLEELTATPDDLRKLATSGLWREPCDDAVRRAEGFNRVTLAVWG